MPGKSHGPRSLPGYSPWGRKESDMTERLHFHFPKIERRGFPGGPVVESLPAKAGDTGSVPGPGRSHELRGS